MQVRSLQIPDPIQHGLCYAINMIKMSSTYGHLPVVFNRERDSLSAYAVSRQNSDARSQDVKMRVAALSLLRFNRRLLSGRTSRLHVDSRCYIQIPQEAASSHASLSRSSRCSKPIPIAIPGDFSWTLSPSIGHSRRKVHAVSIEQTAHFQSHCLTFCCSMSEDVPRLSEYPAKVDGSVKQTCLSYFPSYGGVFLQHHFAYAHEQAQLT